MSNYCAYGIGLARGQVSPEKIMHNLGYEPDGMGGYVGVDKLEFFEYNEYQGLMPYDVWNRMKRFNMRVYNEYGEPLKYVGEYRITDGRSTGCVYVEFVDSEGFHYHFEGRDWQDIEFQMSMNSQRYENNKVNCYDQDQQKQREEQNLGMSMSR